MADRPSQALAPLPHPARFHLECPSPYGVVHSLSLPAQNVGVQGEVEMSNQEVLASVTAKDVQGLAHMDQSVPKSEILVLPQEIASGKQKDDQKDLSDYRKKLADSSVMNAANDGYNWRKYGQKQVKSTGSSRSYYRCTNSDCDVKKKVQHCHQSGFVTGVVYKGFHNHDPPGKIRCTQPRKIAAVSPVEGGDTVYPTAQKHGNDLAIHKSEAGKVSLETPELDSSNSDANLGIKSEYKSGDVIERKRRMKEGGLACSAPVFKIIKEPKIVVHAAGDVGISSDGYRWRKYGQKVVKGNRHPRSYYRCTSAGCLVRKHVERDTDDQTAIIVTYEGKHDHDRPVPKKRRNTPRTAAFLIAAAAAAMNNQQCKTETSPKLRSSNQQSADIECEVTCQKALELGGEKALESARTLLSIGIAIKPC